MNKLGLLDVMGAEPRMRDGSAWESNPPDRLSAGHTGFEDRAVHQEPIHSRGQHYPGEAARHQPRFAAAHPIAALRYRAYIQQARRARAALLASAADVIGRAL